MRANNNITFSNKFTKSSKLFYLISGGFEQPNPPHPSHYQHTCSHVTYSGIRGRYIEFE